VLLGQWVAAWERWVAAAFVGAWVETTAGSALAPPSPGQLQLLLDLFVLEKAMLDLTFELVHRPAWLQIPLGAIERLLAAHRPG
jgi:maltose alpha-D-glucosyltransferase/alpha-amylase